MHAYSSPLAARCTDCGGHHLHCPSCGHPVIIWRGPDSELRHCCTACGFSLTLTFTTPAPPAPAADPMAQQREALTRALQASPPTAGPQPEALPSQSRRLTLAEWTRRGVLPQLQREPCQPDAVRLTLAEWLNRGFQPLEGLNPASVASSYRRLFGGHQPRKLKKTIAYSRRELQLLGLVPEH